MPSRLQTENGHFNSKMQKLLITCCLSLYWKNNLFYSVCLLFIHVEFKEVTVYVFKNL